MNRNVILFDRMKAERIKQIREAALRGFPWHELEKYQDLILEPTMRYLTLSQRNLIDEGVYRLAYEMYGLGIGACSRIQSSTGENERRNLYDRYYREQGDHLIRWVANEFHFFSRFDEWTSQSLLFVLEDMAPRWFLLGVDYGIRRKRLKIR